MTENKNEGRWSDSEHINFLKALKKWGRDWKHVSSSVRTRTSTQCRSHAQKFIAGLEKQGNSLEKYLMREFDENQVISEDMLVESVTSKDGNSKTITESLLDEQNSAIYERSSEEVINRRLTSRRADKTKLKALNKQGTEERDSKPPKKPLKE